MNFRVFTKSQKSIKNKEKKFNNRGIEKFIFKTGIFKCFNLFRSTLHAQCHQSATKPLKEVRGNSKKIQEASRNKTAPLPITIPVRGYYDTRHTIHGKNNPVEETRKNTPYMTPQQLPCIIYVQSP